MSILPTSEKDFMYRHSLLLVNSYQKLLGKQLFTAKTSSETLAKELFHAPFALVSHNTDKIPVFNYGNLTALSLFEMSWKELTSLTSNLSAEPINQLERAILLTEVAEKGFIEHYQGVRISSSGKRFKIHNAVVWNLIDQQGEFQGQAACFKHWQFIE